MMGTFFNAHDMIFDKDSVLHPYVSSEPLRTVPVKSTLTSLDSSGSVVSMDSDEGPIPLPGSGGVLCSPPDPTPDALTVTPSHSLPTAPIEVSAAPAPPCHSAHIQIYTKKGAEYAADMQHQREQLE